MSVAADRTALRFVDARSGDTRTGESHRVNRPFHPAFPVLRSDSARAPSPGGARRLVTETGDSVQVVAQHLGTRWVTQLGHRLGFDLADPFTGDAVDLADFV
jgi:hypothetical protein